jgi:hypothetical protein
MDTVTILRDLWRLRLVVVGVALFALLAGLAMTFNIGFPPKFESRKYDVGVAVTRILVDTPSSQVVEVSPKGSDSLGVRANLLASLMVDGVVKAAIAERAGLPPEKLIGVSEAAAEPDAVAKAPGPRSYVLTTRVMTNTGGDQLPIIEVDAQAPDRAGAAKLGEAAVSGLRDFLDSEAARQEVKDADRLQVSGLGAPQAETVVRGPSKVMAVVVVIFVFALGCAGVLGVLALVRGWRAASVRELGGDDWLVVDDLEHAADESFLKTVKNAESPERDAMWSVRDTDDGWIPPGPSLVPSADDWLADERDEPQAKSA